MTDGANRKPPHLLACLSEDIAEPTAPLWTHRERPRNEIRTPAADFCTTRLRSAAMLVGLRTIPQASMTTIHQSSSIIPMQRKWTPHSDVRRLKGSSTRSHRLAEVVASISMVENLVFIGICDRQTVLQLGTRQKINGRSIRGPHMTACHLLTCKQLLQLQLLTKQSA